MTMPSYFSAFLRHHPRLRRLCLDYALGMIINVVCALVVTFVMRIGSGFIENLVLSICIGSLALLIIDGGRLWLWGEEKPQMLWLGLLILITVPLAHTLGQILGRKLLGLPTREFNAAFMDDSIGFVVLTGLACMFGAWFYTSRAKVMALAAEASAQKARAAAIEKQAIQAQLQLLQAQIEPHMLFNTLANLQGMIALDASRAQHMLDQLIIYLRATLSSSRAEQTTLGQEFDLMQAYLGLMAVRMGSRLTYALRLPAELRATVLPPMLLQPLVENAIKHGLEPKVGGGALAVDACLQDGRLLLSVSDTGLGLDAQPEPHATNTGAGIGLANVRERLQALYGAQADFSLTRNSPQGVIARLSLPTLPTLPATP